MITGKTFPERLYKSIAILILACIFVMVAPETKGQELHEDKLQELLNPFSKLKHIKLTYHETRHSLFLKQAQQSHGTIEFSRPGQLIKQVESPDRKRFVIQSEQLIIYSPDSDNIHGQQKTMSLDDYPQFKQFKALFWGLLTGNADILRQYFTHEINFMPDEHIVLTLTTHVSDPFIQNHNNINRTIDIVFSGSTIKSITMTGFGGEKSELVIDTVLEQKVTESHD